MKITKIETKTNDIYTLYDVTEIAENAEWISIRTKDGYKRSVKKDNIEKMKTYEE